MSEATPDTIEQVAPGKQAPGVQPLIQLNSLVRAKTVKKCENTYRDTIPSLIPPAEPKLKTSDDVKAWLEKTIHTMDAPFAYIGDEPNTWCKDWADPQYDFKACIIGGMSYISSEGNLAVPLIYSQLNHTRPQYITERAFFPNTRDEWKKYKKDGVPIFSLENKKPLKEFDILGFSISYIMPFLHIAPMLHYSGINLYALDREQDDPIVLVGGCMSFVTEILCGGRGGVPDICFIGESEDGLEELMDEIRTQRAANVPRRDMLLDIQRRYGDKGIYCPQFYDVEYDEDSKEIAQRVSLEEGIPTRIRKAYVKNLNKGFILTDPFISYAGGMAMGHMEIARGCSSACNFCQEGFNYRPYRERDSDVVVPKMRELMENVGSVDVVPASFTSSDHHEINLIMKRLLEEVTDKVNIISQRADAFGLDPSFAWLTGMGGSKTVSVGQEGISQRMRDVMTKAINEENLLKTAEFALKAGYKSIKYFMITNVPGTTDADYEELLAYVDKVQALKEKYNPKCDIKLSFTPLFLSAFTPFQWHRVTVDERSLTPWIPEIKKRGLNFRLGSGARHDEAYLSQLFHLGDRRITDIMVESALEQEFYHFGATPKGTVEKWEVMMAKKGLDFEFYFQEKHKDWIFSWDHVDNLTEKSALWSEYMRSRQGMGHLEPCINECYQCGACDTTTWRQRKGWAKRKVADSKSVDISKVKIIRQKGTVQRARLRVSIDPSHRYVAKDHWRLQFRRGCYKTNVPLDKKVVAFASDAIKMLNWVSGVDYVDLKLTEHMFDKNGFLSPEFQKWFTGINITDAMIYTDMKGLSTVRDTCLYELPLDGSKSRNEMQNAIDKFMAYTPFSKDQKKKIPNDKPGRDGKVPSEVKRAYLKEHPQCQRIKRMGFQGIERVIVDFRSLVDAIWIIEDNDKNVYLRIKSRGEITPYDIYKQVMKSKWKIGDQGPASRLEYLIESNDDQDDFMSDRCEECDKTIESNLFGNQLHEELCLKHQPYGDMHEYNQGVVQLAEVG